MLKKYDCDGISLLIQRSLRGILDTEEYVKTIRQEEKGTDQHLDLRWMAPESFMDNKFSSRSDIWSFAVLVWEVFSYARKPYGAFNKSEIANEVKSGRRLESGDGWPPEIDEVMQQCWVLDSKKRPTFAEVQGTIRTLLLEDAELLRARIARASRIAEIEKQGMHRWGRPLRGWEEMPQQNDVKAATAGHITADFASAPTISSASLGFGSGVKLLNYWKKGEPNQRRLGLRSNTPADEEEAYLKAIFEDLRELNHPNLLNVSGVGVGSTNASDADDTKFAVLFEHTIDDTACPTAFTVVVESKMLGRTLYDFFYNGSSPRHELSLKSRIDFAAHIALGVEYLHAHQLNHGRLSSAAVYISGSTDRPALKLMAGNNRLVKSIEAQVVDDTPFMRWMSPEVMLGSGLSSASDVFSYSVIVWELLMCGTSTAASLPYAAAFPTESALFAYVQSKKELPALPISADGIATNTFGADAGAGSDHVAVAGAGVGTTADEAAESLMKIAEACHIASPVDRPSIAGVASLILDAVDSMAETDRWEVNMETFKFVTKLGSGQFGDVVKMATPLFSVDGNVDFCAVKILKEGKKKNATAAGEYEGYFAAAAAALPLSTAIAIPAPAETDVDVSAARSKAEQDFLAEMKVMKELRHPNLVTMLGVQTARSPHCMILEFLAGGSLDKWLPQNGPRMLSSQVDGGTLVALMHQVALGFVALQQLSFVHRDLAARNILIDERRQVKVADFGMSRDVDEDKNYYRIRTDGAMPIRWMGPETIAELKCSHASDVYSFGVCAFEVISFAAFPFDDAYPNSNRFMDVLCSSEGLLHEPLVDQADAVLKKRSLGLPGVFRTLITSCVQRDPQRRPTFTEIAVCTSRRRLKTDVAAIALLGDDYIDIGSVTDGAEDRKSKGTSKV